MDGERQHPGVVSLWKQVVSIAAYFCFVLFCLQQASLQLEQFHIKYKRGVRGDDPRVACGSISHIGCAGDFSPLAQAHLETETETCVPLTWANRHLSDLKSFTSSTIIHSLLNVSLSTFPASA